MSGWFLQLSKQPRVGRPLLWGREKQELAHRRQNHGGKQEPTFSSLEIYTWTSSYACPRKGPAISRKKPFCFKRTFAKREMADSADRGARGEKQRNNEEGQATSGTSRTR